MSTSWERTRELILHFHDACREATRMCSSVTVVYDGTELWNTLLPASRGVRWSAFDQRRKHDYICKMPHRLRGQGSLLLCLPCDAQKCFTLTVCVCVRVLYCMCIWIGITSMPRTINLVYLREFFLSFCTHTFTHLDYPWFILSESKQFYAKRIAVSPLSCVRVLLYLSGQENSTNCLHEVKQTLWDVK